jgi:tape measure domain-containing protein
MEGGDLRMTNSIDTRIVELRFDNAQFERGIQTSLKALETLNKGLKLDGATKGLDHLSQTASRFSLGNLAAGVSSIASRFTTMGVVGTAALASIGAKAAAVGAQMLSSLTVSPIKAGLQEYETNLGSIQTILANTGLEGKKGLLQVTTALDELNHYSDQTIYNFSEMAKNIGTFTAAGVNLETSTAAIKGIANLAAISGSNSQQAATAMYQLSQAMAAGKATLVDWNSVVNAGMGGKVFQEALKETARVQGVAIDDIIKKNGSFRDSLQEGWLTTKVLTETLSKFTGDLTADQLKAMGYNEKQIAGILKMGKTAQDAATKVKTASQLISTLQEAASSGWAKTWQLIFGDFDEAKTLFTGLSNTLGGFIQRSADARNKVLGDWKKLGGRTVLIQAISMAFKTLMDVIKPIKDAFRDIFPPTTGRGLYNLTVQFRDFIASIKPGEKTLENLRRTFRGVFAIFSIGISIVKGIVTAIASMFSSFSGGSGGILEFTGTIGDWLVALDRSIKKGEGFKNFFVGLGKVLAAPIIFLKIVIGLISDLISGAGNLDFSGLDGLSERFAPLQRLGGGISKAWSAVIRILQATWNVFESLVDKFQEFFSGFGDALSESFAGADYNKILDSVNTGLLAGLVLLFRKFLSGGINIDLGGGVLETIKDAFGGLTGVMSAMQAQLKANALLKIAGAIALLTVSVVALSTIDSKKLTTALSGLTVMFTQLLVAMGIMDKIASGTGFLKMPFLAASMISLAIALDLLAIAVAKISKLSWEDMAKGLTGVATLLASLSLFTRFSATNAISGVGLILLAAAINILVQAVDDFAKFKWEEIAKGLVGIGALLASLALFTKLSAANKGGIAQGAGLILLAVAINLLADAMDDLSALTWEEIAKGLVTMAGGLAAMGTALALVPPSSIFSAAAIFVVAASLGMIGDAVASMGSLNWETIAKGLTSMAGALTLISLAIGLLPPTSLFSAAAIFVVAASLGMIGDALSSMGGMSWEEIAKGLVTLAGSLGILAGGLYLMTGTLAGAAALLVAAAALSILTPVLKTLGSMSLTEIGKALLALAGAFVVLGVAGLVLAPLVPVLLALGVAVGLLGAGLAAAGAGVFLFSVGLTALATAGAAGAAVLVGFVRSLLGLIPEVMRQIGLGIVAFARVIATAGPAIVQAITTVLLALMAAITRTSPKIIETLGNLMIRMLNAMIKYVPQMVSAGAQILIGFLNGLASKMDGIVKAAANLIIKFLNAISNELPRIAQAGANLVIKFINTVADTIRNNSAALGAAGGNLASAIIEGMAAGLAAGAGRIASKAKEIASGALNAAKSALGIKSPSKEFEKIGRYVNDGFRKGLDGNKGQIDYAFKSLTGQISNLQRNTVKDIDRLEEKLKRLRSARKLDKEEIKETVIELAKARAESERLSRAYVVVTKSLDDEHLALRKLSVRYDYYSAKLKAARQNVNDLIKARDDYKRSIRDQYSDLATPEDTQTAAEFVAAGKKQLADTRKFAAILAKLRARGLNDESYRDLLSKGLSALPFAANLLAGGKAAISEVNKLEKDLNAAGASLGNQAGAALYDAGIKAAVGIVKGLESQVRNIEKVMDQIALFMVRSIKKHLGIKSPSRVMMEVGRYTVEGMAKGLEDYSPVVEKSARQVGITAVKSLKNSISGISDVLTTDPNFNPIVRPVLDLTQIQRDASQIGKILAAKPLDLDTSTAKAKDASAGVRENQAARQEAELESLRDTISFTQINNSPKALSPAEIYRQTSNQLSKAKGALTNAE